jgi:hypothetical protein
MSKFSAALGAHHPVDFQGSLPVVPVGGSHIAAISFKKTILRWPALIEARLEVNFPTRVHLLKGNTSPRNPAREGQNKPVPTSTSFRIGRLFFQGQITGGFF